MTKTLSGTQQDGASPLRSAGGFDGFVFGRGEPDFHGDAATLVVGQRGASGAGCHEASLAGYGKFGKGLDGWTYAGHNKAMTAHLDPWIACDHEGACWKQWPEDAGEDIYVDSTVAQVRKDARAHGWQCNRHGDYCPIHRKASDV